MFRRIILFLSVLVFLGATYLGLFELQQKFRHHEGDIRGTVLWIATEVNREYWRFLDSLSRYSLGDETLTHDDMLLRRDLFWSQLSTYQSGKLGARLTEAAQGEGIINGLDQLLADTEQDMLALKSGDIQTGQALRERFLEFSMPLHNMTQRVDKAENQSFVDIFNETEESLDQLAMMVIAMSFFGAFLIVFLVHETRRANQLYARSKAAELEVKQANEHLENRVQLRTAQLELERNRAQNYLDIVGSIVVALDTNANIILVNRKGCKILGLDEQQLWGVNWIETFVPESDREKVQAIFDKCMSGNIDTDYYEENYIQDHQGNLYYTSWRNNLLYDAEGNITGLLGAGEDITDQRVAEVALEDERNYLQNIIDGIEDPILVIGADYQVQRMNRSARESADVADLPSSTVTCYQVSHHSDEPCKGLEHPCPLHEVIETGQSVKVVHAHYNQHGQKRTFEIAASPLFDNHGNVISVIESSRDITDHLQTKQELKESQVSYMHLAQHDALTGLPNRLLFTDRLGQVIHSAHRSQRQFAVLYIDLDGFKQVNDSFDHTVGDEVLKQVSQRLSDIVREDDTLARMGGDEFTLIMRHIHDTDDAALLAQKLLDSFKYPFIIGSNNFYLGASIGIAIYPQHGETVENLVRNADAAMYLAKEEGKQTYRYYSEELTRKAFERVLLEANLRAAIGKQQFTLHYQPQFLLEDKNIVGFEALIRWQHPELGLISPIKFIPLAEQSDLILDIGEWVLREACQQMKSWIEAGIVDQQAIMSINLSNRQFDNENLIDMITTILQETGISPTNLELEITETTVANSIDKSAMMLAKLRDLGVKVAIDDFGTGYSSLSHLKHLPFTKVKIDQSFVRDIPRDDNDMAIAKAIIAMGKSLSMDVLAEGIETDAQLEFLIQEGCDAGQGYLFARPLPAAELETFINNRG